MLAFMRGFPVFALVALLPACAAPPPVSADDCGAAALAGFVGRPVATLPPDLPSGARVIGPDTAVTQDYRPDRLNVEYDPNGTVTRLWCG